MTFFVKTLKVDFDGFKHLYSLSNSLSYFSFFFFNPLKKYSVVPFKKYFIFVDITISYIGCI